MTSRADVVAAARGWLGVRWQHQGRAREGVDCVGLVIVVARELGLGDVDVADYRRTPDGVQLLARCAEHMLPKPVAEAQPGDVVALRFDGFPTHLAILTDYPHGGLAMLHAYAPHRKVIEHRVDDTWAARFVAAFALPGVEG